MKRCNKWKRAGALLLATVVLGSGKIFPDAGLIESLASGGSTTPISQYDEATMNLFKDNVLEYWEIPGLIEHYNAAYLNELENFYYNPDGSTGLSKDQLTWIAAELRYEAEVLEEELEEKLESEELKKGGDGYQDYKDNIKTLKRRAREMEDALKGSASTKRLLRIAKNQLTVEISAKMREYQNLAAQHEIQKKNLEISEAAYNTAKRQADLGMYSSTQLRVAENALTAARALTDSSSAALSQKKSELITALGWGYNGNPEILPIPEPDMTKIDSYDLAADMEKAVNNNYDIGDIRKTNSSEYGGAKEKREELDTAAKTVKMQFEVLYKNVLSQKE
ncbi:MAG: TolC family protein, partial [Lachnospiraceae bacterium]|nr:TolC family protein [Lachnospiraceae bacterium]